MSDEKTDLRPAQIIAAAANSKAVEKLAGAVGGLVNLMHNTVDYIAGPKRIAAVSEARAQGALKIAMSEAEIVMLRAETADYVLDREMRKTVSRRSIISEAYKALPPPSTVISDEPVAKDFVPGVLDAFDGISDIEIHKVVGRLIAGEISSPGSFPRHTIRVLRDLESRDFALFQSLCKFAWHINDPILLVFDYNAPLYKTAGLSFGKLNALETLGLVSFQVLSGYILQDLPPQFRISYGNIVVQLNLKEGEDKLSTGQLMFTEAGRRLCGLTQPQAVPDMVDYILKTWRDEGHLAEVLSV